MYNLYRPIAAILNPPDLMSGMPGEILKLSVVVQNLGEQGAVIDVYLDDTDQIPSQWCAAARQRIALDPQQSDELLFEFILPHGAEAGTYDYTIVVDAPEHYPEDTPISYPQQMRVLLREQTVIRINDPSFFLNPATNTQRPARLLLGQHLSFQVRADNRSNLVDKFRLACLDLDEDWYTIRYRSATLQAPGLVSEAGFLELNPNTQGEIQLELHPPLDTLAGIYSPTFRLYSDNQPDLVLLDLIYVDIQRVETLNVEMETIIGRVSHSTGQYRLRLTNTGNVIRQLGFTASDRDEEKLCTYSFDPEQIRLSPSREAEVMLYVAPIHRWRRPFLGGGQVINFQVNIQDMQGYQLPSRLPQGVLTWRSRPWWQLLLLLMAVLGVLGGIGLLIWLLFLKPQPLEVVEFKTLGSSYTEGDPVKLSWTIRNPKQLKKLELKTQGSNPGAPIVFEFQPDQLPESLKPPRCDLSPAELKCNNFLTNARAAGKYTFELVATNRSGAPLSPQKVEVEIAAKPDPKVTQFQPDGSNYKVGEAVPLSWTIEEVGQLKTLNVIAKDKEGKATTVPVFQNQQVMEEFKDLCQLQIKTLTCSGVQISGLSSGQYTFALQGTNTKGTAIAEFPSSTTVTVAAPPMQLQADINGSSSGIVNVKFNEPLLITWQIEGGEGNLKVVINPGGTFEQRSGSTQLANQITQSTNVTITVTDEAKPTPSTQSQTFAVNVIMPPSPSPSPSASPGSPPVAPPVTAPGIEGGV
jgi:hypothetical protein